MRVDSASFPQLRREVPDICGYESVHDILNFMSAGSHPNAYRLLPLYLSEYCGQTNIDDDVYFTYTRTLDKEGRAFTLRKYTRPLFEMLVDLDEKAHSSARTNFFTPRSDTSRLVSLTAFSDISSAMSLTEGP